MRSFTTFNFDIRGVDGDGTAFFFPFSAGFNINGSPCAGISAERGGFDVIKDVVVFRHVFRDIIGMGMSGQNRGYTGIGQRIRHFLPVGNAEAVIVPRGFLLQGCVIVRNQSVMAHHQNQISSRACVLRLLRCPLQQIIGHVTRGLLGFPVPGGFFRVRTIDGCIQHDQGNSVRDVRPVGQSAVVGDFIRVIPRRRVNAVAASLAVIIGSVSQPGKNFRELSRLHPLAVFDIFNRKVSRIGVVDIVIPVDHIDSGVFQAIHVFRVFQLFRQRFRAGELPVADQVATHQQGIRLRGGGILQGRVQNHADFCCQPPFCLPDFCHIHFPCFTELVGHIMDIGQNRDAGLSYGWIRRSSFCAGRSRHLVQRSEVFFGLGRGCSENHGRLFRQRRLGFSFLRFCGALLIICSVLNREFIRGRHPVHGEIGCTVVQNDCVFSCSFVRVLLFGLTGGRHFGAGRISVRETVSGFRCGAFIALRFVHTGVSVR